MKRFSFLVAAGLLAAIVGIACDTSYTPTDVPCGDLTCGEGEICQSYKNSCLPIEYSCITSAEGCAVSDYPDAIEYEACIGNDTFCSFDPDSETLVCHAVGDAGCS
ncbi:MAG: hypothetical protein ACPG4T_06180 [Nannocystaceae bacterium]